MASVIWQTSMRQLFATIPFLLPPQILGCSEPKPMTASDDQRDWLDEKTAKWIENERSSREKLRAEYADLFASVSAILFECDPIGINFDDNTDEYDAEAGSIIPRLRECSTESEVRRVIHEEFAKWFSDTAGEERRYTECARKIWSLWQTQQQP
jgi:hypothetical protein